jgi:hypothetical protein
LGISPTSFHIFSTEENEEDGQDATIITTPNSSWWFQLSKRVIEECEEESLAQHLVGVALVLRPKIKGFRLSKSLVDGGRKVSIMFYDMFKRMKLSESTIRTTPTNLHGIIPSSIAHSLGQVKLRVTFGDRINS